MRKVFCVSIAAVLSSIAGAQLVIYNGLNPTRTGAGYLSLDGGINFEGQNVGSETGELITDSVGATNIISVEGQFVLDPEGSTATGDTAVLVQVYNFSNGAAGSLLGSQLVTHPRETDINDLFTPFGSGFTEADIVADVKIFGLIPGSQYIVSMQQQTPNADFLGAVTLNGDTNIYGRDYSSFGYSGLYGFTNWGIVTQDDGDPEGDLDMRIEGTPEPATFTLVGLGALMLIRRRR